MTGTEDISDMNLNIYLVCGSCFHLHFLHSIWFALLSVFSSCTANRFSYLLSTMFGVLFKGKDRLNAGVPAEIREK